MSKLPHKYISKDITIQNGFVKEKYNPMVFIPTIMYFKWHDVSLDTEGSTIIICFLRFIYQIKINRILTINNTKITDSDISSIAKSIEKRFDKKIKESVIKNILADREFVKELFLINGKNNYYLHRIILDLSDIYNEKLSPDNSIIELNF